MTKKNEKKYSEKSFRKLSNNINFPFIFFIRNCKKFSRIFLSEIEKFLVKKKLSFR